MNNFRRLPNGYSDLGRIVIPPLPEPIILTDRDTGTKYMVTFSLSVATPDNLGHITLDTTLTMDSKIGQREFSAFDGPVFGDHGEYRLMIRGGRIGVDYRPYPVGVQDIDGAPLFARIYGAKTLEKIYTSSADPNVIRIGLSDEVD